MARGANSKPRIVKTLLLLSSSGFLPLFIQRVEAKEGISSKFNLYRRSFSPFSKFTSPSSTTTTSTPTNAQSGNSTVRSGTGCIQPALKPETWVTLGIDNYLSNLPNGTQMSLHDYAFSVGSNNFVCGIGESCQAGQICSPVRAPGWEVLVAAQEWNRYQNKLYDAVGTAIQMVSSISSALVTDLYPPSHTGHLWDIFNSFSLAGGIAAGIFMGVEMLAVALGGAVLTSTLSILALIAMGVTMGVSGGIGVKLALMPPDATPFERWSTYAFYLSEWQQHVQKRVANATRAVINSGISSPQGLASVVKNGTFFYEAPAVNEAELISGLKNTTTARIVVDILRNQNAFVTIGSDKCTGKGPGGAWDKKGVLSYCSSNGTMMNIIHGHKKSVKNTWFNAELLEKKYGITVQYLAEQSFHCQQNHKSFGFDPYKSGAFPSSLDAECIGNLPVCDFRIQELADAKSEKGTMRACRSVGKLPI